MSWSELCYQIGNIYCVPSVHGTLDFAQLTRRAILEIEPDCIAVELPDSMLSPVLRAVRRLPYLSAVTFPDNYDPETQITTYHYIPVQPCDSIVEAVRLADEKGIELYFVDRDMLGIEAPAVFPPDSYFLPKVGLKGYVESYISVLEKAKPGSPHHLREREMAYRVKKMSEAYRKVLFVYGLYHHENLITMLNGTLERPPDNETPERDAIEIQHLDESSYREVLGTMPYQAYLYEIGRKGLTSFQMGIELPPDDSHTAESETEKDLYLQTVSETALRLKSLDTQMDKTDQYDNLHEIFIQTRRLYKREWDDQAPTGKLSIALRFARNYALVQGSLVPSPYQIIISAKNTINDDFAWEMARLLQFYPFLENQDSLPPFKSPALDGDDKDSINRFISHLPTQPWIMEQIPLKKRPKEKRKGDWEKVWNSGYDLVSYPAEDIVIENYFHYLRQKGRGILEKEHHRTVEFKSSILDGLDTKETIRNLHLGKIFVREQLSIKGDVGTVVMIFVEKELEELYPFHMTWYAEHQNESDLALFSTPPGDRLIGPGISRAEYGGLLSVYPPRGIKEVWTDERFSRAKTKAERLLMAAIFHSDKKYILYVAPTPPTRYYHTLAERHGHHIIHIPLSQLSDNMLVKVKFFHFLADRRLRSIASRYIRLG
ncbi:MAG: hypothetical protein OEZ36_01600 [Spirochaetota bacterium]|nr:hypothetical protein [Spirochaetota bacterium]